MKIDGKEKTIAGLIGAILILAGFGGNALLTDDEFKNAYVCDITEELGIFAGGISGTAYTGYPNVDNRKSPTYCKSNEVKGKWIQLDTYAKSKGVDPLTFLIKSKKIEQLIPAPERLGTQYICSPDKCIKIR